MKLVQNQRGNGGRARAPFFYFCAISSRAGNYFVLGTLKWPYGVLVIQLNQANQGELGQKAIGFAFVAAFDSCV